MEQGEDSQGNIWLAGDTVVKFDPRSGRFEEFGVPRVPDPGEGHRFNLGNLVSDGQKDFGSWVYALAVDSNDNVWYTHYDVGHIARIDTRTGQTRTYRIPDAIKIKGIDVAPDGTVWFGNFVRGTLGKLDPTSGRIEQYQPPTRFAEYYTAVVAADGKVWLSDFSGGQMTRFDPATKQFTEYPLPAPDGMVRFFGLDPKGHVWYVDFDTGIIGVLDPGGPTTL
jgi:streptogramin lyase